MATTTAALASAGRLDTPAGSAALALASRIDLGTDHGSAIAAMVKELRASVADATAGVPVKADQMDELKLRRERRLAG